MTVSRLIIVTIDGPAGAGKSSVAKLVASRLGLAFLDTGSMYRAVALLGIRRGVDWSDPDALSALATNATLDVVNGRTLLDGNDVTDEVRLPEVAAKIRFAADNVKVRRLMVAAQRRIAAKLASAVGGVVTEGRDQGSEVFPDAACKIFLTASPDERARRRQGELLARGVSGDEVDLDKIRRDIEERDRRDAAREIGALRAASDAIPLNTDGLTVDEVVERIVAWVNEKV